MAALLAYALAVQFLERVMPRFLAILLVYLIVLGALSALLYLIVQVVPLSDYVRFLLTPSTTRSAHAPGTNSAVIGHLAEPDCCGP